MPPPGRRKISTSQWELLVDSYSRYPESHASAARAAKVYPGTAIKAWHHGLQGHGAGKAIKEIVQDVQNQAAAKLLDERNAARKAQLEVKQKAVEFAVDMHAREGKLAGGNIANATLVVGVAGQVLTTAFKAAPWIMRQLEACTKDTGDVEPCKACGRPFPPGQALGWLERAVRLQGNGVDGALRAVELLRLHVGEPQKILRLDEAADRTPEEALAVLDRMRETILAAQAAQAAAKPTTMPKAEVN